MRPVLRALAFAGLFVLTATAGDFTTRERQALEQMAALVRLDEAVMRCARFRGTPTRSPGSRRRGPRNGRCCCS